MRRLRPPVAWMRAHRTLLEGPVQMFVVVEGEVRHGDRRGRTLGFPTANIHGPDAVRLDGVYAGTLQVHPAADGPSYVTAVSVGHRPTFYGRDAQRLLEAHLLNFSGDLYGTEVRVELHTRLRPQRKYVDHRTLVDQLRVDVEATRAWARASGLDHLLGRHSTDPARSTPGRDGNIRPTPVIRRASRLGAQRSAERVRRREEAIARALTEPAFVANPSPEWLAQYVGVPVDFARKYLEAREESASTRSPGRDHLA